MYLARQVQKKRSHWEVLPTISGWKSIITLRGEAEEASLFS